MYKVIRLIAYLFFKIFNKFEVEGIEKIPRNESLIICPNHKSNLDPIFVSAAINYKIYWMAKKELFENKFLAKFLSIMGAFPVDREGADVKSIKNSLKLLKNNNIVGIFPEGTRVKNVDYSVVKPGTVVIAHRAKAIILPVYIDGDYRIFKKIKLLIRDPIDIRMLPKLSMDQYKNISIELMKSIYNGVDEY